MEEEKKGKKKERRREERKEEGKGKAKQSKVSMMELAKDLEKKRRREEEGVRVCGPAAASASASVGESVLIRHWPASTPTFSLFPFFFPSSLLSSLSSLSSSLFHHFASPPPPPDFPLPTGPLFLGAAASIPLPTSIQTPTSIVHCCHNA